MSRKHTNKQHTDKPNSAKTHPIGLAIDTTFDDTSIALIRGRREVLANVTLSQYADHAEFGGVVPERASRKHLEVIHPLIEKAFQEARKAAPEPENTGEARKAAPEPENTAEAHQDDPLLPAVDITQLDFKHLDYVAVSNLPGLMGSILVGMTVAKSLAYLLDIPLIGINHIEAHPYANFLVHGELPFPLVHLVAAGGHTLLIHQTDHFRWDIIGRSVDDAAGECVDKVAKMFGYPMPGGPNVDKLALAHPPGPYNFPKPMLNDPGLDFSFSGLKTALLYFLRDLEGQPTPPEGPVLSAFFSSVSQVLTTKTLRAAKKLGVPGITVSGGLAASKKLRQEFEEACQKAGVKLYYPPPQYCTDNAAMVGCLAAYKYQAGLRDSLDLEGYPNLPM